jgi:hypothetical protein
MGNSEQALSGQALIEDIRRNDYMIGLDMPRAVEGAANSLRGQLNNALRLLAERGRQRLCVGRYSVSTDQAVAGTTHVFQQRGRLR